ncbi:MAG: hypothetical protein HDR38_01680 [Treponema sp.]|nr:hypothetical protein [Treponema sp.]
MKRLLLVATSVLCLVVFFFACSDLQNLSEPKKVVVKPGDAKYSIPFGGYSVVFNDYLNVTKLQENLTGSDDEDSSDAKLRLSVYDYQDPNEKHVQKYIIEYPIMSVSLNPDDYLGNITDFLQDFKLSDGGSQISIPINDVFEQVSKKLADCKAEVDVPLETLNKALSAYPRDGNQVIVSKLSVTEEISLSQIGFDYGAEGFIKNAVIENGAFTIACKLPGGWSGVTATVNLSVSGAIEKTSFKNTNKGSEYLIRQEADLSGKTIDGKEKDITIEGTIRFDCNNATIVLNNGTLPSLTLDCVSQIKKIRDAQIYLEKVLSNGKTNLTYNDSVSVSIPEYVKNCKIVKLDMQAAVDTNLAGVVKKLYIAPKITSVAMGIAAADYTEKYSNMFADDGGLRITKEVGDSSGWEGFYLVNKEKNERLNNIDLDVVFDIRGDNYNPDRPNDYTEIEDTITITNFDVTSDTDYYLKPTFGAPKDSDMLECDDLELQIDSGLNQEGEIETGLSIGDMLDNIVDGDDDSAQGKLINDLIDAIELQGIEGYLYVTAPKTTGENPLQNLPPIKGDVTARYDGGEVPLFEMPDDSQKSLIKYGVPSFASLADENCLITNADMFTKYYSARTAKDAEEKDILCKIINDRANDLTFAYDISFGDSDTITLTRAQIRDLQEAAKDAAGGSAVARAEIAMTIAVVLPLKLNLTKDIKVENIMTLAGDSDEDIDLLGGEDSDTDFSEYTDYTEALKSVELRYQFKNPLGVKIDAEFSGKKKDAMPSEEPLIKKKMFFDNRDHSISLEPKEIDKVLTESSFIPQISMTLKEGEISVKRNAELKMNAALVIKTDNNANIEFEL